MNIVTMLNEKISELKNINVNDITNPISFLNVNENSEPNNAVTIK